MNGKDIMKSCRQSAEYNAKFQAHLDKIYQDERTRLGLDIPETVQSNSISNSCNKILKSSSFNLDIYSLFWSRIFCSSYI